VKPLEPLAADIAALLASERTITPESSEFRQRALRRAEAALASRARSARFASEGFRLRWLVVAAAIAAAALAAAATESRRRSVAHASALASAAATQTAAVQAASATPSAPAISAVLPAPSASSVVHAAVELAASSALELQLLQPARTALQHGDFSTALAAVAAHARRFPRGQLSEERESLRVFALLGAGRHTEAERVAAAFRRHFPHSMLLARMDAALGAEP
jgi:hypothetical protein